MIALLQFAMVGLSMIIRMRWGLVLFVFFLAFSPRSLAFAIGTTGLNLSFPRLAFPLIAFFYFIGQLMRHSKGARSGPTVLNETVFVMLMLFSVAQFLASLINGVTVFYALDSILFTLVAFILFFATSSKIQFQSILNSFLVATAITAIIVAIEFTFSFPLHYPVANKDIFVEGVLKTHERFGVYRAQGIFDNPLLLAEYAVYMLPIIKYKLLTSQAKARYYILLICVVLITIATGSRSGIIALLASYITFSVSLNWFKLTLASRMILGSLIAILIFFSFVWAFGVVIYLGQEAQDAAFNLMDAAERSTMGRALQYVEVYTTLLDNPFFGFGVLQNFSDQLEQISRIDNYILRTGLEAGFPGIVLFIMVLFTIYKKGSRIYRHSAIIEERAFRALTLSLLTGFFLMKLFVSIPSNNAIFFVLMGSIFGLLAQNRKAPDAHSARS